ncbi:MAG TPA: PEP-CTERM sorting domain-containing protein [Pyrinomonadaceae bacterium]|nr:PEP-CTERM sorting domain-containing protein [Pyrinomonadaceae bacterium]
MRWMQRVIAFVNREIRFRALKVFMAVLMLGAVLGAAPAIKADPIVPGNWYEFQFGLGGISTGVACTHGPGSCIPSPSGNTQFAPDPPWTFSLLGPGFITVTDVALSGDAFNVFDFGVQTGVLVGLTPFVSSDVNCGLDPVPCSTDPGVSHGVFSLAPGPHSITIISSTGRGGAAYFRVDDTVPEPTTLLLFASGLGGAIGLAGRKRKILSRRASSTDYADYLKESV